MRLNIQGAFSAVIAVIGIIGCDIAVLRTAATEAGANSGSVKAVAGMSASRAAHSATLLADGRVLVIGGMGSGETRLDSAEIFDGTTGNFTPTGKLSTARSGHTATRLPDGRVLVAGGFNGDYLRSSEIYDPQADSFQPGPTLTVPRSEHTATTLKDGRVLLVGGVSTGWSFLAEAEIFDPKSGTFTPAGRMSVARESHTATLLQNGRVLIAGGHKDRRAALTVFLSTEIFDPARGSFEPGPEMTIRRHKHDAVVLKDGRTLIAGGSDERDSRGAYTSVEIMDLQKARSQKVGDMVDARYKLNGTVIILGSGKILIIGGSNRAEIFDVKKGISETIPGNFGTKRLFSTATLLRNGGVLITGGYDENLSIGQQAWVYREGV